MGTTQQKNPETERFLKVIDTLISEQVVKNKAEFCRELGFAEESLSQMKGGKRGVTLDLISKLYSKFGGNPIFILSGKGSQLYKKESALPVVREADEKYESREHFEELIAELRQQNERLSTILAGYIKQAELNIKYTELLEKQLAEQTSRNAKQGK